MNLKRTMLNARSQARRLRATGFHLHDVPEQASPQRQTSIGSVVRRAGEFPTKRYRGTFGGDGNALSLLWWGCMALYICQISMNCADKIGKFYFI